MNITATGTSSLTALYLQQLLGSSSTSLLDDSSGDDSSGTDLLTISAAGQQASASQGTDPFQTDLSKLESTIASGDLTSARKAYQAMVDKMKERGDVPSDFAAIGTALDSGDLTAASTAMETVKKNVAAHGPGGGPPPQGSNPLKADLDQLGALISSGDTTSASSLLTNILGKATGLSTDDATSSLVSDLSSALTSGDSSSSSSAWEALVAKLQAQQGTLSSTHTKSMEALVVAAYTANATTV